MKIEFKSNYGNFDYSISAEVEAGGSETLMTQGLANIAYRVAGSSVDKALGVKERKGVAYSVEDAGKIDAAVSKKLTELEAKDAGLASLKLSFHVTGQHEFGEGGANVVTKEATELWTSVQALPGEKFATVCKNLGLGEDYTDEQGILACKKFLAAEKAKAKAGALAAMGAA